MAPFSTQEQKKEALDWVILRDGGIALHWRREYLDEDLEWFRQQNYLIHSFNCGKWTPDEMHADFAQTLGFPSYYGHNLDALLECLEDLSVPERGGMLVVLNQFDTFSKGSGASHPRSERSHAEIVLDILARTSRYFLLTGRRFLTLVQSDDPRLHFARLAGVVATWNWRERSYSDRGL
jgi:barstar (barnase inhibitor)